MYPLLLIIIIVAAALLLVLLGAKWSGKDYEPPNKLPDFSVAKLYFDGQSEIVCRRCLTDMGEAKLILRRRYLLTRDKGVLKVKRLAFIYSCNNCGYKSLDKPNKPE